MSARPPRFLPTVALAALWLALYFLWLAVRPVAEPDTPTQTRGRTAATTSSTTTTAPPLFKVKP